MKRSVRALVRDRAANRCEYCGVPQDLWGARLQIEHVIAQQHASDDDPSNLALACDRCNLLKGPNLSSIDPETGAIVRLFNPREHSWAEHFGFQGTLIVGRTPEGRATVSLLRMNERQRVRVRHLLLRLGRSLQR